MKRILHKIIVLAFNLSTYSFAQQQGLWKTFTTADGLAHNTVNAILESGDGALWFGTNRGVSHYDGIWTTFTRTAGLANNNVTAITESRDGALWFGTRDGVSRFQDGKWTSFRTTDGLANNSVNAIYKSRDGTLWFGTFGGVSHYRDGIWTTFTEIDSLSNNHVYDIHESRDGALWFATANGVSRYWDGNWTAFTEADGLVHNFVLAITESHDGALWFGTGRGVSRYQNGLWRTVPIANGMVNNSVAAILASSDGALWFATENGVSRYQDEVWTTFTTTDGLAHNEVYKIIESSEGALWFGTRDGASRYYYQGDIWINFTEADSLADNNVNAIIESRDKALWFGTFDGVSRYRNGVWTTLTKDEGLANNHVEAIMESRDGALWFGTFGGGVSRYQNGIWTTYTAANELADNHVNAILESRDGALWFGTGGGVSRFQEGKWKTFTIVDGLADNFVHAILESRDGALWFGTGGGTSRFQDSKWKTFSVADGLADNSVYALLESRDGALWFGTYNRVSRYQNGQWTTFNKVQGLADNNVRAIIESSDGALWFGTLAGVTRYWKDIWTTFNTVDGLTDNEIQTVLESSSGLLWFGTHGRGVSRLKPDKSPPFTDIIDGPKNNLTGTPTPQFIVIGRDFRARPDQLSYSYAAVDTSRFPRSSDWHLSKLTAIQTQALLNGTYTFYVSARDAWGNVDPTPETWTFTVDITQPTVTFNSHKAEDIVAGKVALIGNAFDSSPIKDFAHYEINYGFGETQNDVKEWKKDGRFSKFDSTKQVFNDTLAIWDTEGFMNGMYWLQLSAYDTLKHESHILLNLKVVKSVDTVDSRGGSNLVIDAGNIAMYFPPNTFPKDTQLNVRECQDIIPKSDPQVTFVNLCFEIAPAELRLDKPATLTLHYPDSVLINKNEKKLALYYSAASGKSWQRLGGSVDMEKNKITTTFKQAGVFALYEDLSTGNRASILNVSSQPRVFSPQGGGFNTQTAISFDLGKESNVTIKIYNAAGRLVRVLTENEPMPYGTQVKYWDGKDQSGHYCLSGLHLVTIQAEDKMVTKTVVVLNK